MKKSGKVRQHIRVAKRIWKDLDHARSSGSSSMTPSDESNRHNFCPIAVFAFRRTHAAFARTRDSAWENKS
jgi:hypothetical protein